MAEASLDLDQLTAWIRRFATLVSEQRTLLTDLDAAIGDADHGTNMDRGLRAVCEKLDGTPPAGADALFKLVGTTLVSTVGGASGALYGTLFLRLGAACGPGASITLAELVRALGAGVEGVAARGHAELGDKTMLDALRAALDALDAAAGDGEPADHAFAAARDAAERGRDATIPMVARKGRASYLGERSAGHQDPGATSAALLLAAAAATFTDSK